MMESEEQPKRFLTIEELLAQRTEGQITIEATVDTGFEFMAIDECRSKFGEDLPLTKFRGSIIFNIDKSKYSLVPKLRSVDNLYLIISYSPSIGLAGKNAEEDLKIAKMQAHAPDWDQWLDVWCELSGFEGVTKPTPEQFEAANERASKDKEKEKARQAERQQKHRERQQRFAEKRAQRKARDDLSRSRAAQKTAAEQHASDASTDNKCANDCEDSVQKTDEVAGKEEGAEIKKHEASEDDQIAQSVELDSQGTLSEDGTDVKETSADTEGSENLSEDFKEELTLNNDDPKSITTEETDAPLEDLESDEVESLPDYERDVDKEIAPDISPAERVLRFRATCFRVGKHSFKSMEAARDFGGELQEKFNWVVDLVNFHAEVVLSLHKDAAQVSIALTKRSLHRRNITFFGPTTLRATVCHNLLRLADIVPGEVVLDPLAGGGSIPIEGAMSFPGSFHLGGDINNRAMSRAYSNVRCLQQNLGHGLPLDTIRWDSRRLPLRDGSVDVIVSDLPFGIRMGTKPGNRNLYRKVLLEMARIATPQSGRAILLTQDRKSFGMALARTFGLWWQSRVLAANIGGLDAAVYTLRRTARNFPDETELKNAGPPTEEGSWRSNPQPQGNRGWGRGGGGGRGRGRGGGRGRGNSYGNNYRRN